MENSLIYKSGKIIVLFYEANKSSVWNAFLSFFASEVNTELKKMGIRRGQDLESVRYIPLIKLC